MILVTGCPRSGTAYYAGYLRSRGLDVQHEKLGKDGTSDWRLAPRIRVGGWSEIIHLVRHPLDCIASLMTIKEPSWKILCRGTGIEFDEASPVLGARIWLGWNALISSYDKRIRIEDVPIINVARNERSHPSVSWEQLGAWSIDVSGLATKYGYE
jgi:hypothetical protein